jgi:hypothetical protein
MLYKVMLCYVMLCCVVLCCVVLFVVLCYVLLCYGIEVLLQDVSLIVFNPVTKINMLCKFAKET